MPRKPKSPKETAQLSTKIESSEQPTNEKQESNTVFEEKIKEAADFNEIINALQDIDGLQGSHEWFSSAELVGRAFLIKAGKLDVSYITQTGGLREKIIELLGKNEVEKAPIEETPAKKTETAPETPILAKETAAPEQEKQVREKINLTFSETVNNKLQKLEKARKAYEPILTSKIREEQNQTRLQRLMQDLKLTFNKRKVEGEEEFQKAEDTYNATVSDFAFCLEEVDVKKLIDTLGERGLEIAQEEKKEIEIQVINQIIVEEKKIIQNAKERALSEKEKNIIDKFTKRKPEALTARLAENTDQE